MKLEASFSAMSQVSVLALTQSLKVLKEIDLLFFLALTHSWNVLKWIWFLPTSHSLSWKEAFFLPDLHGVLKEVFLPLFLTVSLSLLASSFSSCDSYAVYHRGLERSQLMSVLVVSSLCVGWGLERSFCAHTHSHSLERTEVLIGLGCNSLVPLWCFAIYLPAGVLKGISGAGICLVFFYSWNRLGYILA